MESVEIFNVSNNSLEILVPSLLNRLFSLLPIHLIETSMLHIDFQ